ncbi:MAG: carboxymuconolactone decarboxylase family protein [Planctomycetes bacterium]|nr:carboxymuconolactone decarboxylase family protein [Planctomycetota bacterium]
MALPAGIDLDELLQRDGLAPEVRLLVAASVAIWRGDWPRLAACARRGRERQQPRQDFEEALLQAVLFAGFPRVVTAFETLAEAWPPATTPGGGALPPEQQAAAGQALFAGIYGRNTESVHAMLRGFHPDFHDFVLEAAYGRVLARPWLTPRARELMAVAVLAAQDQLRQFVGHARGALHFGATRQELREALVTALGATPQVDAWLQRVR